MEYGFVCQPISNGVLAEDGFEVVAYEILAREVIDDRPSLASTSVLDWAREKVGRLREIDRDALELAIAAAQKGVPHHVNISVETVGDWGYFSELGMAYQNGVPQHLIVLEVSEAIDPTPESVQAWIAQIKAFGFPLILDDFGHYHGNNRAHYLLRPAGIKIDGDLVRRISDPYVSGLIEADLAFCKKWDLFCVAEHVENELIYRELVKLCDRLQFDKLLYQGWYFGTGELCKMGRHAETP